MELFGTNGCEEEHGREVHPGQFSNAYSCYLRTFGTEHLIAIHCFAYMAESVQEVIVYHFLIQGCSRNKDAAGQ